jgi:putative colanic acid biosynthesis UDP-glucose lipid carrier transferase
MELETIGQWRIISEAPKRSFSIRSVDSRKGSYIRSTLYTIVFKRVIDVVVSALLIVFVLSWLTPLLAVLIRLNSRGPVFFIQQRIGLGGKPFRCIKFRTMRVNEDSHILQAVSDDERITQLGHFLRITHIDELPQLINVLLNHMSLIGPRPHMLYHDLLFSDMLPAYHLRHLVKPGITGLAQSYGYYGATPDFFSIAARTRLDLFYVRHVSSALDLTIIADTLVTVPTKWIKNLRRL